ncbi:1273_t:CDS:2 [Gigaspora rosea]|nr:1273_t:CDS:2 [Gigaspora rosea]
MCLYPPAKKRGPKNRQKNLLHNDISRVQKNDTINNLTERINNAENMLVDLNKVVSDELIDKSREPSAQSFDKHSQSITATTFAYEQSFLSSTVYQETVNNYMNLQYGNSTSPIEFTENSLQYFSQDISPFYQSNNMILTSQQSDFEGQSYVLQDTLPTFLEDNTLLSEVYSTLITEESNLTEAFPSDKHSL